MRYGLNILVQGFCPLKIKITRFPDGFRSNALRCNKFKFSVSLLVRGFFRFFLVSERRQVVGSTRRGKGAVLALSSTPRKKPKRLQPVLAFWAKYSVGKNLRM